MIGGATKSRNRGVENFFKGEQEDNNNQECKTSKEP